MWFASISWSPTTWPDPKRKRKSIKRHDQNFRTKKENVIHAEKMPVNKRGRNIQSKPN